MAARTVPLDLDAYDLLVGSKREQQSIAEVIRERFPPRKTAAEFLTAIQGIALAEDTLDAVEGQVKARGQHPATSAPL